MLKIKLTENQLRNLLAFLNRAELKGSEVPVFVEVLNALNNHSYEKEE